MGVQQLDRSSCDCSVSDRLLDEQPSATEIWSVPTVRERNGALGVALRRLLAVTVQFQTAFSKQRFNQQDQECALQKTQAQFKPENVIVDEHAIHSIHNLCLSQQVGIISTS